MLIVVRQRPKMSLQWYLEVFFCYYISYTHSDLTYGGCESGTFGQLKMATKVQAERKQMETYV